MISVVRQIKHYVAVVSWTDADQPVANIYHTDVHRGGSRAITPDELPQFMAIWHLTERDRDFQPMFNYLSSLPDQPKPPLAQPRR